MLFDGIHIMECEIKSEKQDGNARKMSLWNVAMLLPTVIILSFKKFMQIEQAPTIINECECAYRQHVI